VPTLPAKSNPAGSGNQPTIREPKYLLLPSGGV
jgi:hypothetical protein